MNIRYIVLQSTYHCKEANHGRSHHISIPDTARAFGVSAAVADAGQVANS